MNFDFTEEQQMIRDAARELAQNEIRPKAAKTDDLRHTVDYGGVATAIVEIVEGPPVNLIETLATRIAERCLGFDYVRAVTVTVHKPQAPIPVPFTDVYVRITRTR